MGFIKRFRARHEERRKLYKSIVITHKAILKQLGLEHHRSYLYNRPLLQTNYIGYGTLNEEVRSLYRELIGQVSRWADIVLTMNLFDTWVHRKELITQSGVVKYIDDETRGIMFSSDEQSKGKLLHEFES